MTQAQSHEAKWQELFQEERSRLIEIAELLLDRGCPEHILETALAELSRCPFDMAPVSATLAVVKAAIAYNYTFIDSWIATASSGTINYRHHSGTLPLQALPWAERAVCFLREVLRLSERDTAVLLGISEQNVDQLNRFAAKRMGASVDTGVRSNEPRSPRHRASRYAPSMPFAAFE
jgi:hypothetical protein